LKLRIGDIVQSIYNSAADSINLVSDVETSYTALVGKVSNSGKLYGNETAIVIEVDQRGSGQVKIAGPAGRGWVAGTFLKKINS
jgi:hypothetical protein